MLETLESRGERSKEEQYLDLIRNYRDSVGVLKKLGRKKAQGVIDEELVAANEVIERERHETHLQLIEAGKRLGKSKSDVLVDIIRRDGTLDEYGLPEFCILTENDIIDTGGHDQYIFNVDTDNRRSAEITESPSVEGEGVIKPSEVMLVFSIVPIVNYGVEALEPEDYSERVQRAKALAGKVHGKIFEEQDSGYHRASAKILGVIIPRKNLESIVNLIRNNPSQYRLGRNFYSSKDAERNS